MATKEPDAPAPIEELITCGACTKLLHRPMILACHHSVCEDCLPAIEVKQGYKCPMGCATLTPERKFIIPDARTTSLVNFYKKERKEGAHNGLTMAQNCGLCKTKEASYHCVDCNLPVCTMCQTVHTNIPGCANHVTKNLNQLMKSATCTVRENLACLQEKEQEITKRESRVKKQLGTFEKEVTDQMREAREQTIEQVETFYESEAVKVRQYFRALLEECEENYGELRTELDRNIDTFMAMLQNKPDQLVQLSFKDEKDMKRMLDSFRIPEINVSYELRHLRTWRNAWLAEKGMQFVPTKRGGGINKLFKINQPYKFKVVSNLPEYTSIEACALSEFGDVVVANKSLLPVASPTMGREKHFLVYNKQAEFKEEFVVDSLDDDIIDILFIKKRIVVVTELEVIHVLVPSAAREIIAAAAIEMESDQQQNTVRNLISFSVGSAAFAERTRSAPISVDVKSPTSKHSQIREMAQMSQRILPKLTPSGSSGSKDDIGPMYKPLAKKHHVDSKLVPLQKDASGHKWIYRALGYDEQVIALRQATTGTVSKKSKKLPIFNGQFMAEMYDLTGSSLAKMHEVRLTVVWPRQQIFLAFCNSNQELIVLCRRGSEFEMSTSNIFVFNFSGRILRCIPFDCIGITDVCTSPVLDMHVCTGCYKLFNNPTEHDECPTNQTTSNTLPPIIKPLREEISIAPQSKHIITCIQKGLLITNGAGVFYLKNRKNTRKNDQHSKTRESEIFTRADISKDTVRYSRHDSSLMHPSTPSLDGKKKKRSSSKQLFESIKKKSDNDGTVSDLDCNLNKEEVASLDENYLINQWQVTPVLDTTDTLLELEQCVWGDNLDPSWCVNRREASFVHQLLKLQTNSN